MLSSSVPLDIIDTIIGELEDDHISLRNCSTVAYSFLAPSQRRLFSLIRLYGFPYCQRLYGILLGNSNIITYIRELQIHGNGWLVYSDTSFEPLFQLLADSGTLRTFSSTVTLDIPWDLCSPSKTQAILNLLRSASVHSISLINTFTNTFPVEIFAMTPSLKHLVFYGKGVYGYNVRIKKHSIVRSRQVLSNVPAPIEPRELKSLTIGGDQAQKLVNCLTTPQSPLRISRLRDLSICGEGPDLLDVAWDAMCAAQGTIETMSWDYCLDEDVVEEKPIDMQILQRLHRLTFKLRLISCNHVFMIELLRKTGLPPNLEKLNLVIDNDSEFSLFEEELGAGAGAEYAEVMDKYLAFLLTQESYPSFRCVDVEVCEWVSRRDSGDAAYEEHLRTEVLGLFPHLNAAEKLSVTITLRS